MTHNLIIGTMLAGIALCSCSRAKVADVDDSWAADTLTHHARYLTIADRGSDGVAVDISNPLAGGGAQTHYLLVHRDSVLPDDIPASYRVVRVPVERAAVFSSVHTSALAELGALEAVAAIADRQYFTPGDTLDSLIESGRIADLGSVNNPSVELMAAVGVDVVLRSPSQETLAMRYPAGAVEIECTDYLEPTPISRAEWILLLGELSGNREGARRIFDQVIDNYESLAFKASAATSPRPKILAETEYSGVWYVPAGESYMARLYADAGADWPWADTKGTGSLALSLEEVAAKALDADMWLVRSYGYNTTRASLKALNSRYTAFKAWKDGAIYSCDSRRHNIFNDAAFHPDKVLAEYIAIFHPEIMEGYQLKYFNKTN